MPVFEKDSALDLLEHRGLIKKEERVRAHALAVRAAQMLSALLRP